MMKRHLFLPVNIVLVLSLLAGCGLLPGPRELSYAPEDQLVILSREQFREFVASQNVVLGTDRSELVEKVGLRLAGATEEYLALQARADELGFYSWTFSLLRDSCNNLWAAPGGFTAVCADFWPYVRDEGGLAAIIAHEYAHLVAGHGRDLMAAVLKKRVGKPLSTALLDAPDETREIWREIFGMGTPQQIYPYSMQQEKEADRIALILLALGGYEPRQAVEVWENLLRMADSGEAENFFLQHPLSIERIEAIGEGLPTAMRYFE